MIVPAGIVKVASSEIVMSSFKTYGKPKPSIFPQVPSLDIVPLTRIPGRPLFVIIFPL